MLLSVLVPFFASTALGTPLSNRNTKATPSSDHVSPQIPYGERSGDAPIVDSHVSEDNPEVTHALPRSLLSSYGSYAVCEPVTVEQYNNSPMRAAVEDYAKRAWGDGFTVLVNPTEWADKNLVFCTQQSGVRSTFTTQPSCISAITRLDSGASVPQGTTTTHDVTVRDGFDISLNTDLGAHVEIPQVADFAPTQTLSLSGKFHPVDTISITVDDQTQISVLSPEAVNGSQCHEEYNLTSCAGEVTAYVPGAYSGWVWFRYTQQKYGHWNWAVSVESVLSPEQRSDNVTLVDSILTSNAGAFDATCA